MDDLFKRFMPELYGGAPSGVPEYHPSQDDLFKRFMPELYPQPKEIGLVEHGLGNLGTGVGRLIEGVGRMVTAPASLGALGGQALEEHYGGAFEGLSQTAADAAAPIIRAGTSPGRWLNEKSQPHIRKTLDFFEGGYADPAYYVGTAANMIPDTAASLVAGAATGGMAPLARGAIMLGATMPGVLGGEASALEEKLKESGMSANQAAALSTAYSIPSSVAQSIVEAGVDLPIIDKLMKAKKLGARIGGAVLSGFPEAGEEVVQGGISYANSRLMDLEKEKSWSELAKDLGNQAAGGFIGGVMMGGGAASMHRSTPPVIEPHVRTDTPWGPGAAQVNEWTGGPPGPFSARPPAPYQGLGPETLADNSGPGPAALGWSGDITGGANPGVSVMPPNAPNLVTDTVNQGWQVGGPTFQPGVQLSSGPVEYQGEQLGSQQAEMTASQQLYDQIAYARNPEEADAVMGLLQQRYGDSLEQVLTDNPIQVARDVQEVIGPINQVASMQQAEPTSGVAEIPAGVKLNQGEIGGSRGQQNQGGAGGTSFSVAPGLGRQGSLESFAAQRERIRRADTLQSTRPGSKLLPTGKQVEPGTRPTAPAVERIAQGFDAGQNSSFVSMNGELHGNTWKTSGESVYVTKKTPAGTRLVSLLPVPEQGLVFLHSNLGEQMESSSRLNEDLDAQKEWLAEVMGHFGRVYNDIGWVVGQVQDIGNANLMESYPSSVLVPSSQVTEGINPAWATYAVKMSDIMAANSRPGATLAQDNRATMEISVKGTKIQLHHTADATTIFHEIMHYLTKPGMLSAPEMAEIKRHWGDIHAELPEGTTTSQNHPWEKMVRSFERWMRDGYAPTPAAKNLFQKIAGWFRDVYKQMNNSEYELTKEQRDFFKKFFTPQQQAAMKVEQLTKKKTAPRLAPLVPAGKPAGATKTHRLGETITKGNRSWREVFISDKNGVEHRYEIPTSVGDIQKIKQKAHQIHAAAMKQAMADAAATPVGKVTMNQAALPRPTQEKGRVSAAVSQVHSWSAAYHLKGAIPASYVEDAKKTLFSQGDEATGFGKWFAMNVARWNRFVDGWAKDEPYLVKVDTALRKYFNTIAQNINDWQPVMETLGHLEANERVKLGVVMDQGRRTRERDSKGALTGHGTVWTDAQLKGFGLNEKQIAAYHLTIAHYQQKAVGFVRSAQTLRDLAINMVKNSIDVASVRNDRIQKIEDAFNALERKLRDRAYVPEIRFGDRQTELWRPEDWETHQAVVKAQAKYEEHIVDMDLMEGRAKLGETAAIGKLAKMQVQAEAMEKAIKAMPDAQPVSWHRYDSNADLEQQLAVAREQYEFDRANNPHTKNKQAWSNDLVKHNTQELPVPTALQGLDANYVDYLLEQATMAVGHENVERFVMDILPGIAEGQINRYMAGRASTAQTVGFAGRLMASHYTLGANMDVLRAGSHYTNAMAKEAAVREHKAEMDSSVAGIKSPKVRAAAFDHIKFITSAPHTSERVASAIKGYAAFSKLGFKPMFALQNIMQRYTHELPIFKMMYAKNTKELVEANKVAAAIANPERLKRILGKGNSVLVDGKTLAPPVVKILDDYLTKAQPTWNKGDRAVAIQRIESSLAMAEASGAFGNDIAREVFSHISDSSAMDPSLAQKALRKVMNAGGWLSSPMEEANRRRTFLTDILMRDILGLQPSTMRGGDFSGKKTTAVPTMDGLVESVVEGQRTVDRLHNGQGRRYYSRIEQSLGSFGALALQFKQFAIDYTAGLLQTRKALLDALAPDVASGKMTQSQANAMARKPIVQSVATISVLGGVLGMPMAQQLVSIIAAAFSDDEEDFLKDLERRMIDKLGGGEVARRSVKSIMWGWSHLLGIDIGSSFSMGEMFFMPEQGTPAENLLAITTGASGDVAKRFLQAYNQTKAGDPFQALMTASPDSARFLMRAAQGTIKAGGEKYHLPPIDRALAGIGIRTDQVSGRYDISTTQRRLAEARKNYYSRYAKQMADDVEVMRDAVNKGNMNDASAAQARMQTAREAFRDEMAKFNSYAQEVGGYQKYRLTMKGLTEALKRETSDKSTVAINRRVNELMKRRAGLE